jgi:CheY-specific phosphatase CheX
MGRPRAEVINAFVAAVVRVLRSSLGEEARLAALQVTRSLDPAPSIAVTIELTGGLKGPVTWVFSPDMARHVANTLLMQDDAPSEVFPDAAAELANIVAGQATQPLVDAGYAVDIHPPIIHDSSREPLDNDTVVVTVSSPSGNVRIFFGLEAAA